MSFDHLSSRVRDDQDGDERMIWNGIEYVENKGAVLKVKGTGTEDEEVVMSNFGYGMNINIDSDGEVLITSMGSDTNLKYGAPQIPAQFQRQWKEQSGGIQNPLDGDKALEFNTKRTWATEANFAIGQGLIEVVDGRIIIRGPLTVDGPITSTSDIVAAGELLAPTARTVIVGAPGFVVINVPDFEE